MTPRVGASAFKVQENCGENRCSIDTVHQLESCGCWLAVCMCLNRFENHKSFEEKRCMINKVHWLADKKL